MEEQNNNPIEPTTPPVQPVQTVVTPPVSSGVPTVEHKMDGGRLGDQTEDNTVIEDRIFAALSYISVMFIVPLILKNENEDIHFHAKQGLVLFGAEMAVWFALFLFDTFLTIIFPTSELVLVRILGAAAWIGFMALSLFGIYAAARGKRWNMPVINRLAARIKL